MTANPLREEAPPQRAKYKIGQLVVFMGDIYVVAMVLDISVPPYPRWPVGIYAALRWPSWPQCQFFLVPENDIQEAQQAVC